MKSPGRYLGAGWRWCVPVRNGWRRRGRREASHERRCIGEFRESQPLTLGVELELQLLSRRDYDLTRGATDLMQAL